VDLNKIIDMVIGGAVGGILLLFMRFQNAQKKIVRMEEESKDVDTKNKMHLLSDSELDALLRKDIGPGNSDGNPK
jgi:hypothetical protein